MDRTTATIWDAQNALAHLRSEAMKNMPEVPGVSWLRELELLDIEWDLSPEELAKHKPKLPNRILFNVIPYEIIKDGYGDEMCENINECFERHYGVAPVAYHLREEYGPMWEEWYENSSGKQVKRIFPNFG